MPKKYIPFIPEPIEGQAVLGNFNRVLKYRGADEVNMTLQRGMPLYEVETTEIIGENPDGNLVIRGECVSACAYLKEQGIEVDLVYIDPPFASGADYAKKVYIRRNPKVAKTADAIGASKQETTYMSHSQNVGELASVAEQGFAYSRENSNAASTSTVAEQKLDIDELRAFEEKMYGDVWDKEKYLNWMYENLMAIKSVMSDSASIYVHLDWHIGHYVKVLMDEIFGEGSFVNEIIWYYYNKMPDLRKPIFTRAHDTIYLYRKNDDNPIFNLQKETRDTPVKQLVRKKENGKMVNARDNDGNVLYRTSEERIVDDVWRMSMLQPADKTEPVDYATQKPEALLERIIRTSSNDPDENGKMLVADFFGGSGVTAAVASRLGRRFIHCDVGINSVQTTRDRLKSTAASFSVLDVKDGVSLYRNPAQTMEKIKSLIPGLKNEDSLDSFWAGAISDSRLAMIPVYLPDLKDSGTKLLDKMLINRIIHQAIPNINTDVMKIIVYYVDITSEAEILKSIDNDDSTIIKIELRDLKTILDDVVVNDYLQLKVEKNVDSLFGGFTVSVDKFVSDRVMQKIDEFNQKAFLSAANRKPYSPIVISEDGLELIELISADCTADSGEWHSDSEVKVDKLGYAIKNGEKTKEFWDGSLECGKRPLRIKVRNICGDESVWSVSCCAE